MKKYDNILIITDNLRITERFVREVIPLITRDINFEFACSPYSNIEQVDGFKFRKIDLREVIVVDKLIKTKDLIISIHCKQLFPVKLIKKIKCINVHPGYNPVNRGWFPQVFAIINNYDIGATIHEIDDKLDNGNIICRSKVQKYTYDTSDTLYNRVVEEEIKILIENINSVVDNTYKTFKPEDKGNLFLKKDFDDLCFIDMAQQGTFREFYDRLRALSHSPHQNAYFLDEYNQKIFMKIEITKSHNLSIDAFL